MGLKLNLGCGETHLDGYINVDKYGEPDLRHDLETFPWPWDDNSVSEVCMSHVLEHLGETVKDYKRIMQELYRVCEPNAKIEIAVPHHRHDNFHSDPTHVRAITPLGLSLMSQKNNREWIADRISNSPLGIYWGVDFEVEKASFTPSQIWRNRYPKQASNVEMLLRESRVYANLIEQVDITVRVVKPAGSMVNEQRQASD
jgi:hypothetical protein